MLKKHVLEDIQKLQSICEQEEKIELKLNFDMLRSRKQNDVNDFFIMKIISLLDLLVFMDLGIKLKYAEWSLLAIAEKRFFQSCFLKLYIYVRSVNIQRFY